MAAENKKYELIKDDTVKNYNGDTLYRIRALMSFGDVKAGDLGGYIQDEKNLCVTGDAWVGGEAWVSDRARVSGDAWVGDRARVSDRAWVGDRARVGDRAWVTGEARVGDDARVGDRARVGGEARVGGNLITATRSDYYTFSLLPTDAEPMISAGCRYFTFTEAEAHWRLTRAGTKLGDETFAILEFLKNMAKIQGLIE